MTKKLLNSVWTLSLIVIAIMGYQYYQHQKKFPSTDDAYLNANTIQISSQITGPIAHIYVKDNAYVKKGTLLFTIDPTPFELTVSKAKAALKLARQTVGIDQAAVKAREALVSERRAQLVNAKQTEARILPLVRTGRMAQTEGDKATRERKVADAALVAAINELHEATQRLGDSTDHNAHIMQAQAALAQAELELSYTEITAPNDGYVLGFNLRPGTLITAYHRLFSLVDNQHWWVDANFKETQLRAIRSQQKATIQIDSYPQQTFTGRVDSIRYGSGNAFSLLPAENASGNWVKVTQRFPVKVLLTNPPQHLPLRIGASCTVTIDTQSPPATHTTSSSGMG